MLNTEEVIRYLDSKGLEVDDFYAYTLDSTVQSDVRLQLTELKSGYPMELFFKYRLLTTFRPMAYQYTTETGERDFLTALLNQFEKNAENLSAQIAWVTSDEVGGILGLWERWLSADDIVKPVLRDAIIYFLEVTKWHGMKAVETWSIAAQLCCDLKIDFIRFPQIFERMLADKPTLGYTLNGMIASTRYLHIPMTRGQLTRFLRSYSNSAALYASTDSTFTQFQRYPFAMMARCVPRRVAEEIQKFVEKEI